MKINPESGCAAAFFSTVTVLLAFHSHQNSLSFIPATVCAVIAGTYLCDSFGNIPEFHSHHLLHAIFSIGRHGT